MKKIIEILKKEVEIAKNNNEIPVGAVIVDENNNIIASGHNDRQNNYNVLGHAEINAIINAEKNIKDWRLNGYSIYVTLEPCDMCSYVIKEARIDKVYFFVNSEYVSNNQVINKEQLDIDKYKEIYTEFKRDIQEFFKGKR